MKPNYIPKKPDVACKDRLWSVAPELAQEIEKLFDSQKSKFSSLKINYNSKPITGRGITIERLLDILNELGYKFELSIKFKKPDL